MRDAQHATLEVFARRSQHRGAPVVQTRESELMSSLTSLQCRAMPCITGPAGAQQFRRAVQREHWTCLGCLRACAAGPPQKGAPGGTFKVTVRDCVGVVRCHLYLRTRRNELYAAMAGYTLTSQRREQEVFPEKAGYD